MSYSVILLKGFEKLHILNDLLRLIRNFENNLIDGFSNVIPIEKVWNITNVLYTSKISYISVLCQWQQCIANFCEVYD